METSKQEKKTLNHIDIDSTVTKLYVLRFMLLERDRMHLFNYTWRGDMDSHRDKPHMSLFSKSPAK